MPDGVVHGCLKFYSDAETFPENGGIDHSMNGIDPNDIQLDDLTADFREIVDTIGLGPALALAEAVGGGPVHIPSIESVFRKARNRKIRAEFDGANLRALSKKYRLSVTRIRVIVGQGHTNRKTSPVDKQMQLF